MIKIILFKNNLVLISRLEEVGSEMGEPDCKLIDPFELKGEFLESWPSFTMQREMMVHSDSFLTIIEPDKKQLDKYQSLTAKDVTKKS
tara:strand:+ start:1237 stop:1500 length:264 start_codon:yes stop_codon:yes gene_type:complete